MTTIVGIQLADRAIIYADNQVSSGNRKYNHKAMAKITKRGDWFIAGAGEVAPLDIAHHIWNPPSPNAKDIKNLYHFVIAKVMPSLRDCMKENGYDFNAATEDEYRFRLLIATQGEIFEIDDDLSVCLRNDGMYGIGSGHEFALGALHAGASPIQALEIASKLDLFTGKPFIKRESKKPIST